MRTKKYFIVKPFSSYISNFTILWLRKYPQYILRAFCDVEPDIINDCINLETNKKESGIPEPRHEKTCFFACAKIKAQKSAAWLIEERRQIVKLLFLLNPLFQASSHFGGCTARFVSYMEGHIGDR